jgi:hypothetical protein
VRWLPFVACALAACESNGPSPRCTADLLPPPPKDKVDVLFVVDNTQGMASALEAGLANSFSQLLKQIDQFAANGHPASYHFGIVTTDLGSGPTQLTPDAR